MRSRAGKLSTWIGRLLDENDVAAPYSTVIFPDEPRNFPIGLDPKLPDDRTIAHVLEMVASGLEVAVLTGDVLMAAKLKSRGLERLKPSTEDKLPEEKSEAEAKAFKLARELDLIRNRLPKLGLDWSVGGKIASISFSPARTSDMPTLEAIKRSRPKISDGSPSPSQPYFQSPAYQQHGMMPGEVSEYNNRVGDYWRAHALWYEGELALRRNRSRVVRELGFLVSNTGSGPASAVRLIVSLPLEIHALMGLSEIGRSVAPPRDVGPPRQFSAHAPVAWTDPTFFDIPDLTQSFSNPSAPKLSTERHQVSFALTRLQHHSDWCTQRFAVSVAVDAPEALHIGTTLICDELPKPVESTLVLKASTKPSE